MHCIKRLCLLSIIFVNGWLIPQANAEDLLSIYRIAQTQNATLQAAREAFFSMQHAIPAARADLLPNVSGSYTNGNNRSSYLTNGWANYKTEMFALNISQPIFDYSIWLGLKNSEIKLQQASCTYAAAEQDLLFKVSSQYFSVLESQDTLAFAIGKQESYAKSLDQANQRFAVGLIAITDVQQAQAAFDSARADTIAAEATVFNEKEKLQEIVGQPVATLAPLIHDLHMAVPEPNLIDHWVTIALKQNLELKTQSYNSKIAKINIRQTSSGHLPTVSLNANLSRGVVNPLGSSARGTDQNVGLTLSVPIFQSGKITSQTRQAVHTYNEVSKKTEQLLRSTARLLEGSLRRFLE